MKQLLRIALNLFLPPGVAIGMVFVPIAIYNAEMPQWSTLVMLVVVAYGFAAIPSIVHTLTMERFYSRGLLPSEVRAIGISSLSGMFSGLLVLLTIAAFTDISALQRGWFYPIWGLVTGAITAILIRLIARKIEQN